MPDRTFDGMAAAGAKLTFQRLPARAIVLAAVVGLSVLTACGQGQEFDREAAAAGFSAANPGATPAQADCVVGRLIDRYGLEQLEAELAAEPSAADFEENQFRDMFACGMEGDVRAQIVEQLEANDVPAEHAPCVADALVGNLEDEDFDVLLSGQITDGFLAKFVAAMERCGAINS